MRTAQAQGIGRRGVHRTEREADWRQTWPFLALSWAENKFTWAQLGRNWRRTRASGPNLGPTWARLGSNMAQLGPVGLSMRNLVLCVGHLGAKLGPIGAMWATWPCTNPHQSQKRVALSMWSTWKSKSRPKVAQLGTLWRPASSPTETQHGEHCFKRSVIDREKSLTSENSVLRISDWAGYVPH